MKDQLDHTRTIGFPIGFASRFVIVLMVTGALFVAGACNGNRKQPPEQDHSSPAVESEVNEDSPEASSEESEESTDEENIAEEEAADEQDRAGESDSEANEEQATDRAETADASDQSEQENPEEGEEAEQAQERGSDEEASGSEEDEGGTIDKKVVLGVKPGRMQYDTSEFSVPAGGRIRLVFDNSDGTLQHNVLICVTGDKQLAIGVAQDAWNMKNPMENDYVPDTDKILFHTSLLNPGEKETITFQAPEEPGDHPYVCSMPGHAATMNGIMHVTSE